MEIFQIEIVVSLLLIGKEKLERFLRTFFNLG